MGEIKPVLRLNLSGCGVGPDKALEADRYQAALDMAAYADTHGFYIVNVEEHHDVDIGWLGSPLTMAAAIAARTSRVQIRGSAVLVKRIRHDGPRFRGARPDDGFHHRNDADRLEGRAVRLSRHDGAHLTLALHHAAPAAAYRRYVENRRPPRRPLRPALLPGPAERGDRAGLPGRTRRPRQNRAAGAEPAWSAPSPTPANRSKNSAPHASMRF